MIDAPKRPVDGAAGASAQLRVLIVDDSSTDRELITQSLGSLADQRGEPVIDTAGDGAEAIAAVGAGSYDLIFLDDSLPRESGLDVLARLLPLTGDTPIVMTTGSGDERVAVSVLQGGAADDVPKELGYEEALPFVGRRALDQRAKRQEAQRAGAEAAARLEALEGEVAQYAKRLGFALREAECLRRVTAELSGGKPLREGLDVVTQALVEATSAQAAAVLWTAGSDFALVSVAGQLSQAVGEKGPDLRDALNSQMSEVMVSPIRVGTKQRGVLWMGTSNPAGLGSREKGLLESFAYLAGTAVAAVRQSEERPREAGGPSPVEAAATEPVEEVGNPPDGPTVEPTEGRLEEAARTASPVRRFSVKDLKLPAFPKVLDRLLELVDGDGDLESLVRVLELDPALAARALRITNSAAYGRGGQVTSLGDAILALGRLGIRNVAVAQFTRGLFSRKDPLDQLLWEQALGASVSAQAVMEMSDTEQESARDDAYLCGLVAPLGRIALCHHDQDTYSGAFERALSDECSLWEAERDAFGTDGLAVTCEVIRSWSLPPVVQRTLGRVLDPASDDRLALAVDWSLAFGLARNPGWIQSRGDGSEPEWLVDLLERTRVALDLTDEKLAAIEKTIMPRWDAARTVVA